MIVPVRNEQDRQGAHRLLDSLRPPFTVTTTKGAPRSIEQNRLQRLWCWEAEQYGDQTAEEYRGFFKLCLGVPILRHENERFCETYDRLIKPRPYHEKLELMMEPIDLPVTRLMTVDQKTRYLDAIYQHCTGLGMPLTRPGGD